MVLGGITIVWNRVTMVLRGVTICVDPLIPNSPISMNLIKSFIDVHKLAELPLVADKGKARARARAGQRTKQRQRLGLGQRQVTRS